MPKDVVHFHRNRDIRAAKFLSPKRHDYVDYMAREEGSVVLPFTTNGFFSENASIDDVRAAFRQFAGERLDRRKDARCAVETIVNLPNDITPSELAALARRLMESIPAAYPACVAMHSYSLDKATGEIRTEHKHLHVLHSPYEGGAGRLNEKLRYRAFESTLDKVLKDTWVEFGRDIRKPNAKELRTSNKTTYQLRLLKSLSTEDLMSGAAERAAKTEKTREFLRRERLKAELRQTDAPVPAVESPLLDFDTATVFESGVRYDADPCTVSEPLVTPVELDSPNLTNTLTMD